MADDNDFHNYSLKAHVPTYVLVWLTALVNPILYVACNATYRSVARFIMMYHSFNDENRDHDDDDNDDDDGVSIMEMHSFFREKLTRASLIGENMTSLTEPQSVTRS